MDRKRRHWRNFANGKRSWLASRTSESGFSLAELALVLLIVMFTLGGILIPFSAQVQSRRVAETQKNLDEIKEALIGYAVINRRLPRPAESATVGTEKAALCTGTASVAAGICTGFVPWTTLGVNKLDAWGKMIKYSVTPDFTTTIAFTTGANKTVRSRNPTGAFFNLAIDVPVVLLSHGANNFGASEFGVNFPDTSATNIDEDTNNSATRDEFISRLTVDSTIATGGEFDDMVTWIPTSVIFDRMMTAGHLP